MPATSLNSWLVSNVTNMARMLSSTNLSDQSLNNWDILNVTDR
ncbi:BspA family leucine-rich repeat surface protein [Psychroflexus planctonicus]